MLNVKKIEIESGVIKNPLEYFNTFFGTSLIYAFISALIIYKHLNGIGILFFAIATNIYAIYCIKVSGNKIKTGSKLLMCFLLLIATSTFLTNDTLVVFVNYIFMFVIVIIMLIHNYVDDEQWDFSEYLKSFLKTILLPISLISNMFPKVDLKKENNFCLWYIIIGILTSICILIFTLPALLSADFIFDNVIKKIMNFELYDVIAILFIFIFLLFASFCGIKFLNMKKGEVTVKTSIKYSDLIGITAFLIVSMVYSLFSFVQIFGLFLNKMQLPQGESFSNYARNGFFQLLYVAAVNLLIIIISFYKFNKNKLIDVLLTIISINTYIMLASSAYRLYLYTDSYQLTKLRLYAFLGMILVFCVLSGALFSIYFKKFKLITYAFISTVALWTMFSFMKPEYIIARYNLSTTKITKVDIGYFNSFSADAAEPLFEKIVKENIDIDELTYTKMVVDEYFSRQYDNNEGLNFNYSIYHYNKYKKRWLEIIKK